MDSIEALWAVYFGDADDNPNNPFSFLPGMSNAGVAVIETTQVFGGDSQFFYLGSVKVTGTRVTAKITVTHFNGPGMTAFGVNRTEPFDVEVDGSRDGNTISGEMWTSDQPKVRLKIMFQRLADLP